MFFYIYWITVAVHFLHARQNTEYLVWKQKQGSGRWQETLKHVSENTILLDTKISDKTCFKVELQAFEKPCMTITVIFVHISLKIGITDNRDTYCIMIPDVLVPATVLSFNRISFNLLNISCQNGFNACNVLWQFN